MNNCKKRVKRYYKNFKKSNFGFLNKILRILSWLLPGLVIKRWMLTSAIGFLTTLLGLAIWTNLRPLYWLIEIFFLVNDRTNKYFACFIYGTINFCCWIIINWDWTK